MFALERATSSRRVTLWTILGLILVPLVVAGGFLWATWGSTDRLGQVPAAIVNNDDPVTINKQLVPLGRQLAGGLVSDTDDPNFSWLLTDTDDAADGLASGRYAAVVTIPKDFSANATSFSKTETSDIKQAMIGVQTSQISGIADPVVGQAITAQATKVLNTTLTKQYLDNIYVGFNTLGKQFGTLADAAGKLSDGTSKLSDGIGQTASGTGSLANGLSQLDDGAQQLATGMETYADGVGTFADKADDVASGTAGLAKGTKQLSGGVHKLSGGADQLANGADGILSGVKLLQNGGTATQGLGTKPYIGYVQSFSDGLKQYQSTFSGFAQADDATLAQTPLACPAQIPADSCAIYYAGVKAGTGAAAAGLADQGKQPGLVTGSEQLIDGAKGLNSIVSGLKNGPKGNTGVTAYAKGMHAYADGVAKLDTGAKKLAGGTADLATGLKAFAGGAHQLATGADKLSTGVSGIATGTAASADGTAKLYDGMSKLADGGQKLATGSDKFATGLDKGKDAVPSYDAAQRKALSTVVATPVTTPRVDTVFSNIATTTFLAVIALWLGAQASYLVLGAISRRVVSSMKPSWRLALEGLAPAALISVLHASLLTFVLQRLLHLSAGQVGHLLPFTLLAGLAFVAVNHALVSWFGGIGRFVSVILVVVSAAGAITSAVPELFASISPYLPLTPAMEGIRAIVSGGSGAGSDTGALLAWLLIGVSTSVVAVARKRMVAPLVAVPA